MKPSLLTKLSKIIEGNPTYIVEGKLNKNLLAADARKYDANLLNLLQKDTEIKSHFFSETDGGLVFKKDVFLQFINNKEFLPDSFTKYKIKIGLGSDDGSLLAENGDVVLNWPYKDAILEGGQDKEDQKRSEVFFNEVLAPDQITRLLDDKVFTNWKRFDTDGEHDLDELKATDNLILKGNNLVVLHSLKKRFAGKVKLIYIDPPFNTGKDSFNYNDRFNRSTWLTFMRNRLSAAKTLLADNGSIFVHLDFNESHYAKVLMDEIFGEDNFKNNIVWCYTGPAGANNFLPRKHDDILYYGKSASTALNMPYIQHKSGVHNTGQVFGNTESSDGFKEEVEARGKKLEDWWIDIYSTDRYRSEAIGFTGQKPELLMQRIIDMASEPGDIVLDYHVGSGTTAAVAHKMGRQYIGIEQLYYGDNDPTVRLQNVINGDTTGISKSVDWQGGGSFVYANIMNNANSFRERVERAKNDTDYTALLNEATSSSFLSYRVDPSKLNEDEFRRLSAAEKRQLLLELIDNNTLYVNYEDINDPVFKVSGTDKKFNDELYKKTSDDV